MTDVKSRHAAVYMFSVRSCYHHIIELVGEMRYDAVDGFNDLGKTRAVKILAV